MALRKLSNKSIYSTLTLSKFETVFPFTFIHHPFVVLIALLICFRMQSIFENLNNNLSSAIEYPRPSHFISIFFA